MRQTNLSLDELAGMLPEAPPCSCRGNQTTLPAPAVANEVGEIFRAGGAEREQAEVELVMMLADPREDVRWVAFKYLNEAPDTLSEESRASLQVFMDDPENADAIARD